LPPGGRFGAIWVTLWAIIVIATLALIITVVAWFAIP
jgi:hypothetical protein